ncbi:hypothetical protein ARSEF1564_007755 [Beauveria bassiana]
MGNIIQRQYAEDTVFWSLTPNSFSVRAAAPPCSSMRRRRPAPQTTTPSLPTSSTFVDNTPQLWNDVRRVLAWHDPARIAVNAHPEIAFASGLHAGELAPARRGLGDAWADRCVLDATPMLAVEYGRHAGCGAATVIPPHAGDGVWATIAEGFSERVVTPGRTTPRDVGVADARADSEPQLHDVVPSERDGHQAGYALGSRGGG